MLEMGLLYVAQTGSELLSLRDPPASAFCVTEITGMHHPTLLKNTTI
jgi:hypothetical protein